MSELEELVAENEASAFEGFLFDSSLTPKTTHVEDGQTYSLPSGIFLFRKWSQIRQFLWTSDMNEFTDMCQPDILLHVIKPKGLRRQQAASVLKDAILHTSEKTKRFMHVLFKTIQNVPIDAELREHPDASDVPYKTRKEFVDNQFANITIAENGTLSNFNNFAYEDVITSDNVAQQLLLLQQDLYCLYNFCGMPLAVLRGDDDDIVEYVWSKDVSIVDDHFVHKDNEFNANTELAKKFKMLNRFKSVPLYRDNEIAGYLSTNSILQPPISNAKDFDISIQHPEAPFYKFNYLYRSAMLLLWDCNAPNVPEMQRTPFPSLCSADLESAGSFGYLNSKVFNNVNLDFFPLDTRFAANRKAKLKQNVWTLQSFTGEFIAKAIKKIPPGFLVNKDYDLYHRLCAAIETMYTSDLRKSKCATESNNYKDRLSLQEYVDLQKQNSESWMQYARFNYQYDKYTGFFKKMTPGDKLKEYLDKCHNLIKLQRPCDDEIKNNVQIDLSVDGSYSFTQHSRQTNSTMVEKFYDSLGTDRLQEAANNLSIASSDPNEQIQQLVEKATQHDLKMSNAPYPKDCIVSDHLEHQHTNEDETIDEDVKQDTTDKEYVQEQTLELSDMDMYNVKEPFKRKNLRGDIVPVRYISDSPACYQIVDEAQRSTVGYRLLRFYVEAQIKNRPTKDGNRYVYELTYMPGNDYGVKTEDADVRRIAVTKPEDLSMHRLVYYYSTSQKHWQHARVSSGVREMTIGTGGDEAMQMDVVDLQYPEEPFESLKEDAPLRLTWQEIQSKEHVKCRTADRIIFDPSIVVGGNGTESDDDYEYSEPESSSTESESESESESNEDTSEESEEELLEHDEISTDNQVNKYFETIPLYSPRGTRTRYKNIVAVNPSNVEIIGFLQGLGLRNDNIQYGTKSKMQGSNYTIDEGIDETTARQRLYKVTFVTKREAKQLVVTNSLPTLKWTLVETKDWRNEELLTMRKSNLERHKLWYTTNINFFNKD